MTTYRARRIADLIRHALADIVRREIRDPRVGMVTVTEVRVSHDLKHARVFVSSLGAPGARTVAVEGLNHAAPFLRRALGRAVTLRSVPELVFVEDATLEHGERVERLLREIHDGEHPAPADGDHDD